MSENENENVEIAPEDSGYDPGLDAPDDDKGAPEVEENPEERAAERGDLDGEEELRAHFGDRANAPPLDMYGLLGPARVRSNENDADPRESGPSYRQDMEQRVRFGEEANAPVLELSEMMDRSSRVRSDESEGDPHGSEPNWLEREVADEIAQANAILVSKGRHGDSGSRDYKRNLESATAPLEPRMGVPSHFVSSCDSETEEITQDIFVSNLGKVDSKNDWLEKKFSATLGRIKCGAPDQQPPSSALEGGNAESGASSASSSSSASNASDSPEGQDSCPGQALMYLSTESRLTNPESAEVKTSFASYF